MAQGDIITPEVEEIITEVWQAHIYNGWTAKEIQSEVAERVQEKWGRKYKPDWPGLRAVQTRLVKIKEKYNSEEYQGLDKTWHLGLMKDEKYNIPPEAVPYILIVQGWAEKHPDMFNQPHEPLTIRQALWVSRLYGQAAYLSRLKPKWDFVYFLFQWSEAYAYRERICALTDTPFDTSGFDKGIIEGGLPVTAGKTTLIHYRDKSFAIDTLDEDLLRQMGQMKKEGEK